MQTVTEKLLEELDTIERLWKKAVGDANERPAKRGKKSQPKLALIRTEQSSA